MRAGAAELVVRSADPAWLGLPWELLRDPALPTPLALDGMVLSRGLPARHLDDSFDADGQRLRVLMVISRRDGDQDVGYRMIARPLLGVLGSGRAGEIDALCWVPPEPPPRRCCRRPQPMQQRTHSNH